MTAIFASVWRAPNGAMSVNASSAVDLGAGVLGDEGVDDAVGEGERVGVAGAGEPPTRRTRGAVAVMDMGRS